MKDLELIKSKVEKHFGTEMDLVCQEIPQIRLRAICYDLCRKFTKLSFRVIGEFFGGKNHATVMHGIKTSAKFFNSEKEYRVSKMKIITEIAPYFPNFIDDEVRESYVFTKMEKEILHYKAMYENEKQEKEALIEILNNTSLKSIGALVSGLTDQELSELENFRIKPFLRMRQKNIVVTS